MIQNVIYYLHKNTDQPSHASAISTNNLPNQELHFWHSLTWHQRQEKYRPNSMNKCCQPFS